MNTFTLLDNAYRHLTRRLCRALPPAPADDERADRDSAAIAQVAALQPANTAEFKLAAQFVASSERAQHCLTLADEPDLTPALALHWTGRADLMMRQATSALRSLLRLQAERRKIEADPKAYSRGERIEDHMTVIMAEAVANPPPVSPDNSESHTRHREAQSAVAVQASRTTAPVSSRDPESRHFSHRDPRPAPSTSPRGAKRRGGPGQPHNRSDLIPRSGIAHFSHRDPRAAPSTSPRGAKRRGGPGQPHSRSDLIPRSGIRHFSHRDPRAAPSTSPRGAKRRGGPGQPHRRSGLIPRPKSTLPRRDPRPAPSTSPRGAKRRGGPGRPHSRSSLIPRSGIAHFSHRDPRAAPATSPRGAKRRGGPGQPHSRSGLIPRSGIPQQKN